MLFQYSRFQPRNLLVKVGSSNPCLTTTTGIPRSPSARSLSMYRPTGHTTQHQPPDQRHLQTTISTARRSALTCRHCLRLLFLQGFVPDPSKHLLNHTGSEVTKKEGPQSRGDGRRLTWSKVPKIMTSSGERSSCVSSPGTSSI